MRPRPQQRSSEATPFADELPISIYLNYAKLYQTGEGSANLQRVLIADDALGWKPMDRHQKGRARAETG